jgi:hypothetical protein
MIVDVRRCGDATPEDGICVGGAKGQGRRKRHQGGAEQNEYAHGLSSEIASLCMGLLPQAKKSFQVDLLSSSQTDQSLPVGSRPGYSRRIFGSLAAA